MEECDDTYAALAKHWVLAPKVMQPEITHRTARVPIELEQQRMTAVSVEGVWLAIHIADGEVWGTTARLNAYLNP